MSFRVLVFIRSDPFTRTLAPKVKCYASHVKYLQRPASSFSKMAFPKSMKAITIAKPGEVDVLELTEVPFPEVAPGNVLIKVRGLSAATGQY